MNNIVDAIVFGVAIGCVTIAAIIILNDIIKNK